MAILFPYYLYVCCVVKCYYPDFFGITGFYVSPPPPPRTPKIFLVILLPYLTCTLVWVRAWKQDGSILIIIEGSPSHPPPNN